MLLGVRLITNELADGCWFCL